MYIESIFKVRRRWHQLNSFEPVKKRKHTLKKYWELPFRYFKAKKENIWRG